MKWFKIECKWTGGAFINPIYRELDETKPFGLPYVAKGMAVSELGNMIQKGDSIAPRDLTQVTMTVKEWDMDKNKAVRGGFVYKATRR